MTRADRSKLVLAISLAGLVLCGQLLLMYSSPLAATLPDADDAMRLVELRAFLENGGWFALHEPRLSPPLGYDSHWSRLIDAGLAALYYAFRIFSDHTQAERLTLILWPMLWLLPAIAAVSLIAWRLAGLAAAIGVLVLAAFCGPGMQQLIPGRIDHHNAHIALSLLVVACAVCADRMRWAAALAGVFSAIAIAIGFESLPFLIFAGAVFGLRFVLEKEAGAYLRDYGIALAASTIAVFLLSVPPSRWLLPVCDMIAINSALAVVAAGAGVAVIAVSRAENAVHRLIGLAGIGLVAAAIFLLIEPRCVGGVYALVDPAIRPIWLDHVSETRSLFEMATRAPATALGIAAFPLVGVIALLFVMRKGVRAARPEILFAAAAFLLSAVYMLAVSRGSSYAVWLAIPFAALGIMQLLAAFHRTGLIARFAALFLISPTVVTVGVILAASALGGSALDLRSAERQACVREENYASLAALPKGLVAVNEYEWGPYVLAWSKHTVLAAPYHRIPAGIISSDKIFNSPQEAARAEIERTGVQYLFVCNPVRPAHIEKSQWEQSLLGQLASGVTPAWLTKAGSGAISIYRVGASPRAAQ